MQRKAAIVLAILLAGAIASACSNSLDESNAHATDMVVAVLASQTAEAPTAPPVFTVIPTATITPTPTLEQEEDTIKIGINAPLTGEYPKLGESTLFAARLWLSDITMAGGLQVGDKVYRICLIIEDNEFRPDSAAAANTKLITQDEVLIIVGPQYGGQAVPAGEVADDHRTPMISPWSTNPNVTVDRPWVFRTTFLDSSQASVMANFLTGEFEYVRAAVLYDEDTSYSKELADAFYECWEGLHGAGSVVAFESFASQDVDFTGQLTEIMESSAEFIFAPQYWDEVALIVRQAHDLGWDAPIVGSDSWGSSELINLCGEACTGYFFSTHYTTAGVDGPAKAFIERYQARYGYVPDDVAALTWDTLNIVQEAIQGCGEITGDLATDRKCIRDALAQIKDFEGITGRMTYTEAGDPIKCAVIVRINESGSFEFYQSACPQE